MTAPSFVLPTHFDAHLSIVSTQPFRMGFTVSQTFAKSLAKLSDTVREQDLFSVEKLISPEEVQPILKNAAGKQVSAEAWAVKVTEDQFWLSAFLAGTNQEVCCDPQDLGPIREALQPQD